MHSHLFGTLFVLALLAAPAAAQYDYPSTEAPVIEPIPAGPRIPTSYAELLPPNPKSAPNPTAAPNTTAASAPAPAGPAIEIPAVAIEAGVIAEGPVAADDVIAAEETPTLYWYQPAYWFGPAPWDSGIEFGLNGSGGTSDSLSFRTGGYIKRKADDYKFAGSLYYNKTQSNGVEVQSNALLDVRYDWLFNDSPWTIYVMNQTFYDEFQAFDINVNGNAGIGYQWFDLDWSKLTTSLGTGASREFGGQDAGWVPEGQFGFNYEAQVGDNKKFYAKADWFPEWGDFNTYRVLSDVGMEFELNQPTNMSLKLSATDRYDSDPQGVSPHNLNYSAMLIWKL